MIQEAARNLQPRPDQNIDIFFPVFFSQLLNFIMLFGLHQSENKKQNKNEVVKSSTPNH